MVRARGRTRTCNKATVRGRHEKAIEFWEAATELDILHPDGHSDAVVQLCVLAGIAAADVICCVYLGQHSDGQSHGVAVDLLNKVDPRLANFLAVLLRHKTESAYRATVSHASMRRAALRSAAALIEAAAVVD